MRRSTVKGIPSAGSAIVMLPRWLRDERHVTAARPRRRTRFGRERGQCEGDPGGIRRRRSARSGRGRRRRGQPARRRIASSSARLTNRAAPAGSRVSDPSRSGSVRSAVLLLLGVSLAASACVGDLFRTPPERERYLLEAPPPSPDLVGKLSFLETHAEDTLIDLAPALGVGYVELVAANPGVIPGCRARARWSYLRRACCRAGRAGASSSTWATCTSTTSRRARRCAPIRSASRRTAMRRRWASPR
jgi:hypothetical protein